VEGGTEKNKQIPTPSPYKLDAMKVPEDADSVFGTGKIVKTNPEVHDHHEDHDHHDDGVRSDTTMTDDNGRLSASSPLSGESVQLFP
jgi:hypothetical protein